MVHVRSVQDQVHDEYIVALHICSVDGRTIMKKLCIFTYEECTRSSTRGIFVGIIEECTDRLCCVEGEKV